MAEESVPKLVTTRPEAEIAADLKARIEEAIRPVLAVMDEAVQHGLQVQFDNIAFMGPPIMRHRLNGLRLVKIY